MYKIRFKSYMNNLEVADITYGEFATLMEAAEQISKEATKVVESECGYYSHFNEKFIDNVEGEYKFGWFCDWSEVDVIADCRLYWICDTKAPFGTYLEWNIVNA